ncbi:sorcin-like isoform X1 [Biomphalaria glabrata]|uniref:Sorcin-like isoform X1 n=1 Tax=Biomphalaria glabrata TaxID=6526 RepID=A0A9W3BMY7_BIOGL|nr:sorcin-like isoform X1 [Biomphalaria glabrata]XP_055900749.1 sorcin-like isoform X1 [Biomphalaria glabrata]XP_055900755.1 sorcin-like isoform X1 [Biomphalaria glabrata]XP_055900763.1 sorcin-like isoform X1 [Biomphalaria glabrata]XP_055900770.1 sorcin-like isoform X1 [Biomphalaria glabrata]
MSYYQASGNYQPQPGNYMYQGGQHQQTMYQYAPQPQPQQYQMYQQSSQHYGSYGTYYTNSVFKINAWEAYQLRQSSDLEMIFVQEMQKNPENMMRNAIQAEDLMNVLNNTPSIRSYFRTNWSREMCSIMIAMLDRSQDGFMQWNEFLELQQCLVAWFKVFCQYDFDRSGFIDSTELINVIKQLFGYQIQPDTLETILKRYSRVVPPHSRCIIAFDDFVAISVRLRAYTVCFTDAFRRRDSLMHGGHETGSCTLGYDDFLRCVLCL